MPTLSSLPRRPAGPTPVPDHHRRQRQHRHHPGRGQALGAQAANLAVLGVTAVANTAANRRLTFGTAGGGAGRDQFRGLPVFLLALALTSGALAALQAGTAAGVAPSASPSGPRR